MQPSAHDVQVDLRQQAASQPSTSTRDQHPESADETAETRTWAQYLESWFIPPNTDGGETSKFVQDITQQYDGYQPAAWEEVTEAAYRKDLAMIKNGDDHFADLEDCGFVTVPCSDLENRPVILLTPQRLPPGASSADIERLFKYVIQKLDGIVASPFCVVYAHSGAEEWATRLSGLTLRSLYERLAIKYKLRLHRFYVLHTDMALWGAMSCVGPFMSHGFWGKLRWVSRIEFLWEHIKQANLEPKLPRAVKEHDGILEEQPLHDFGYVKPTTGSAPETVPL